MDEADFYLEDLKSKFDKINPKEYCLVYASGETKDGGAETNRLHVILDPHQFHLMETTSPHRKELVRPEKE